VLASAGGGLPIPERAGVLRYFIRIAERIVWADQPEELMHDLLGPASAAGHRAAATDQRHLHSSDGIRKPGAPAGQAYMLEPTPKSAMIFSCGRASSISPIIRFAHDSPLEGDGFEPSVPLAKSRVFRLSSRGIR
jgi:hypothetical protein